MWFSYFKYPVTSNLFLTIFAAGIVGFELYKSVRGIIILRDPTPSTPMDAFRRIVFNIAQILFPIFAATSFILDGTAISDEMAQSSEGYTAGTFYLATRSTLTGVSQVIWIFMRIFEFVAIPLLIVSVFGSVLYIGVTKRWKSMFAWNQIDNRSHQ